MLYKQTVTKAPKKEFNLPNQDLDEVTINMRLWQTKLDDQGELKETTLLDWKAKETQMIKV